MFIENNLTHCNKHVLINHAFESGSKATLGEMKMKALFNTDFETIKRIAETVQINLFADGTGYIDPFESIAHGAVGSLKIYRDDFGCLVLEGQEETVMLLIGEAAAHGEDCLFTAWR